jgi:hypothetical protein
LLSSRFLPATRKSFQSKEMRDIIVHDQMKKPGEYLKAAVLPNRIEKHSRIPERSFLR